MMVQKISTDTIKDNRVIEDWSINVFVGTKYSKERRTLSALNDLSDKVICRGCFPPNNSNMVNSINENSVHTSFKAWKRYCYSGIWMAERHEMLKLDAGP